MEKIPLDLKVLSGHIFFYKKHSQNKLYRLGTHSWMMKYTEKARRAVTLEGMKGVAVEKGT